MGRADDVSATLHFASWHHNVFSSRLSWAIGAPSISIRLLPVGTSVSSEAIAAVILSARLANRARLIGGPRWERKVWSADAGPCPTSGAELRGLQAPSILDIARLGTYPQSLPMLGIVSRVM